MMNVDRFVRVALCGVAMASASACGSAASAPPVAKVSLSLSKPSVALGGVLDLTYRFEVAADAKLSGDYRVFVHLTREDGTTIWNDDHELPEQSKTARWQPGQVIEYTRTRFIPTFSYVGPATFEVGLYRDDERLPLAGPDAPDRDAPTRSYKVATVELLPRSNGVQVVRLSGWHGAEFAAEDPTVDWQWTQKVAILSVKNPRRDSTFFLEYDTRSDLFGAQPQQVSIYCGDTRLATFAATDAGVALQRIPVTAAQLGSGEMVEFRIELDKTFVPAKVTGGGNDVRDLGIRVYHATLEPR